MSECRKVFERKSEANSESESLTDWKKHREREKGRVRVETREKE